MKGWMSGVKERLGGPAMGTVKIWVDFGLLVVT